MHLLKPVLLSFTFLIIVFQPVFSQKKSNPYLADDLYEFAKTSAVTGREGEASDFIEALLPNVALEKDKLGNLVLVIGSGQPRKLITAPLDEPGYVISQIQDDGYLRINPVGGGHNGNLYHQFLQGHEVKINTENGAVMGVSTVRSAHFDGLRASPERLKKPFQWQEVFIDVGVASAAEVAQQNIQLLDPVTLNKKPVLIKDELIAAPYMRSKAAALALAIVAQSMAGKKKTDGTLIIAWTTLELLNGKGIEAVINTYGPFDEIHRFNRFLESDIQDEPTLLANSASVIDDQNLVKVTPSTSFRTPASTMDFKNQNIYEVGLPGLYADTPVETVAISDVENLIDYWLDVAGSSATSEALPKVSLPDNDQSYTSYAAETTLLSELIGTYGVSGAEERVRNYILSKLPSWAKPEVDEKGNMILTFGQGEDHIVFVAHMDETGYAVDSIRADGKLVLDSRGGMLPWLWEAQPAVIHLQNNDLNGVFEPRTDYKMATQRSSQTLLTVSAGFQSKEEALAAGIAVGVTTVTMPKAMIRLSEHRAAARGFDDRVGCAALLLSLQNLDPGTLTQKVTYVWSVEEEAGLVGATYAAANLKDASVVYPIDTYVSSDDPYSDETFAYCPLGKGAVLRVLESINFISRSNLKMLQTKASANNIEVQYGMTSGGTDGQPFLGYGIPSLPLSWPGRYSHSPVEIMDFRDMNSLVSLIRAIVEEK